MVYQQWGEGFCSLVIMMGTQNEEEELYEDNATAPNCR